MGSVGRSRPKSGAEKMRAAGKVPVMLTVTPANKTQLQKAARAQGRSLAGFITYHATMAACAVLAGSLFPDQPLKEVK